MEESDKIYFKKGCRFLHEYFQGNIEIVLKHLVEKKVYDKTMQNDILNERTQHQKCKKFLDELPQRGPLIWGHLMDIIREELNDSYVVDLIHPGYVKRKPRSADPNCGGINPNQYPDDDDDMGVELSVKPCTEFIINDNVYRNDSTPRGLALIINIIKCQGQEDREGSQRDEVRLHALFGYLGYEVRTERDLTAEDMENHLTEFATDNQHEFYFSCIVTILSHGKKSAVLGSDGKAVTIESIVNKFDNKNAKLLQDKPKFFIFQACRGEREDRRLSMEQRDNAPATNVQLGETLVQGQEPDIQSIDLPIRSDMLIAYSTLLDYVALRHTTYGSRFICTIIDVFKDQACTDHVSDMMTEVNKRMKEMKTDSNIKQQSEFHSNLVKKFYFFPGHIQKPSEE